MCALSRSYCRPSTHRCYMHTASEGAALWCSLCIKFTHTFTAGSHTHFENCLIWHVWACIPPAITVPEPSQVSLPSCWAARPQIIESRCVRRTIKTFLPLQNPLQGLQMHYFAVCSIHGGKMAPFESTFQPVSRWKKFCCQRPLPFFSPCSKHV
jgi:hypothetical protein